MTTGAKILWAIILLGCAMVLVSVATSAELTLAWDAPATNSTEEVRRAEGWQR